MAASFLVENTEASDQPLIEQLLDIAFGIDRRVKTSYRLREGNSPAEGLSLVVRCCLARLWFIPSGKILVLD